MLVASEKGYHSLERLSDRHYIDRVFFVSNLLYSLGDRIMCGKSVLCGNPCERISAKSRSKEIMIFILCILAVFVTIFAAGNQAKADDEANSRRGNAKALLRIAPNNKISAAANGENIQVEYDIFKNTQKMLLLNSIVLRKALKLPGISELAVVQNQKDPIDWLGKNLQITFPGNAEIMQVSLAGASQKELAMLVNAVVDAYLVEVVDAERAELDERINKLKKIQIEKTQECKDALNELRRMAQNLGTSDMEVLSFKQKNTLDELQSVRSESIRSQFALNRMNIDLASQKAAFQTVQNAVISDIECELFASSDFILRKLHEDILTQEKNSDPKNQAELEGLKRRYSERIEQIRAEIKRKTLADIEKEINKLDAAIKMAKEQQEVVQEELKELRKEADRFGISSIDMQMRRRVAENAQKSLDLITAELEKLNIERRARPRVAIVEKAKVKE
jgi:polysaccharide biosynthesis transport protein